MSALDNEALPLLNRTYRLQWEPAQNAHVLLFPEGMVKLNGSAGEILKRCTGEATVSQITAELEQAFDRTGLLPDVLHFMNFALERHWLEPA